MQIFGEIPFIKSQNNTTDKRWKMNEKDLFWLSFYSLFSVWKIVGIFT